MSNLVIVVGVCKSYLAEYSQSLDKGAYLVDDQNLTNDHQGLVYTSLGDISDLSNFFSFLIKAEKIIYAPPPNSIWSDGYNNTHRYSMAWHTERYIILVSNLKKIHVTNLPKLPYYGINLVGPRTSNNKQIWVVGCSTTYGAGVGPGERYSDLISSQLNYPVKNLAQSGSSIGWAADQILRGDICAGDLVIWGITKSDRFTWYIDNNIEHVNVHYYTRNPKFDKVQPLSEIASDGRWYESIKSIAQVINFCDKINANLILLPIHSNLEIMARYSSHPGFIMMHGTDTDDNSGFLDLGSDNIHPGPKTHRLYAEMVLDKIKQLGWK